MVARENASLVLSRYLIAFVLFYTVFVNHYLITVPKFPFIYVIVKYLPFAIVLIAFLLIREKAKSYKKFLEDHKRFVFISCFYLLISSASVMIVGEQKLLGFSKLAYFTTTGILLCFVVYSQINTMNDAFFFRNIFLIVGILASLHGISVRFFSYDPLFLADYSFFNLAYQKYRVSGSMGNPVVYGTLLTIVLPFFLFALFPKVSVKIGKEMTLIMGLALLLISILVSGTRGAYIATFFIVSIFALHFLKTRKSGKRISIQLVLLFAVFLALSHFYYDKLGSRNPLSFALERISLLDFQHPSVKARLDRYLLTWEVLQDKPLLGLGFGNVDVAFRKYQKEAWGQTQGAETPDNQLLMVSMETGLLGLFFCVVLLIECVWHGNQNKKYVHNCANQSLSMACQLSLIGTIIMMLTWDALCHPSIRIYFWVIVAIFFRIKVIETRNTC